MFKILSGIALSATIVTVNLAPVFANTKVESLTIQQASPNLVELEGRSLTDAEAAKVEGEALPLFAAKALFGAGTSVAWQFAQCQARRQSCSAEDYAWAAGTGALGAFVPTPVASKGVRFFTNGQRIRGLRVFVR